MMLRFETIEFSHLMFKLLFSNSLLKLASKYRSMVRITVFYSFFASNSTMDRYFEASLRSEFEKSSLNNKCENSIKYSERNEG